MNKIILYHGSPNQLVNPIFGGGDDKHDYGRGFYLTENVELAKEWAVCRPDDTNGWVHKYELDCDELILPFAGYIVSKGEMNFHVAAFAGAFGCVLGSIPSYYLGYFGGRKFIEKYGIDTTGYDVLKGWRANASYFYIAKEFVRDNIDVDILEELLSLGGLGIQYCIKSELAYSKLHEIKEDLIIVEYSEFNDKYNQRDTDARQRMRDLVDSDANKVTKVFSTLFER